MVVELSAVKGVGAAGVPVNVGEARVAKPEIDAPAGMVTVPVNVGEAKGAAPETSATGIVAEDEITPPEVVLTYPAVVNGSVTVPVNVGEAKGAYC